MTACAANVVEAIVRYRPKMLITYFILLLDTGSVSTDVSGYSIL